MRFSLNVKFPIPVQRSLLDFLLVSLCSARKAVQCPPLELSVADGARVESFNRFRSTWSLFQTFALRLVAYGALGSE